MSVKTATSALLTQKAVYGGLTAPAVPVEVTTWVRNPSWLTLTAPAANEQKFVGLHRVFPTANYLALTAAGNYTVNWGDGVTENFNSGVVAYHEYDFADADLANTNAPVTFQDSGDTVTRTSHGYTNGMVVSFYNIVSTTGLTEAQPYYVVNATTDTFQVSTTKDGSPVALTTDGSGTLLPYKQAIVTVTPQAGQNLTTLNLHQKHNQVGLQSYDSGFVDIALAGANLTDLRIGAASPDNNTARTIRFVSLERVNIVRSDCRQLGFLFFGCTGLQSIAGLATSQTAAQSIAVTFTDSGDTVNATAHGFRTGDCVVFTSITSTTGISINTLYYVVNAAANTFQVSTTFGGSAVLLTTNGSGTAVRGTNFQDTFNGCYNLATAPAFDTSAAINMSNMFNDCRVLASVGRFDTSSVALMNSMFNLCYELVEVPALNTASVRSMNSMFSNCSSLQSVPLLNTAAVVDMSLMFSNCTALRSIPLFNTASVTNMTAMFSQCSSIVTVPLLNTASVTNMTSMFNQCVSLARVPLFNTASVTNMTTMFSSCRSLYDVPAFNTAAVTTMNQMFSGCSALVTAPALNTASVTNMQNMFLNCSRLKNMPVYNYAACTSATSMFTGCSALVNFPGFAGAANATQNFNSLFNNCYALQSVGSFGIPNSTSNGGLFGNCWSLTDLNASGSKWTHGIDSTKLPKAAVEKYFNNLGIATGAVQTLTVTNVLGVDTANAKTAGTTAQSTTITIANTSGLAVGMTAVGTGSGLSTGISPTADVTTDTLTLNSHGLPNGTRVAFTSIGTVTNIATYTIYYVVNSTTNTFQIATTAGGSAIDLTGTNATLQMRYESKIASINTNVSVVMTTPAATTNASTTLTFRAVDTTAALLKGWSLSF